MGSDLGADLGADLGVDLGADFDSDHISDAAYDLVSVTVCALHYHTDASAHTAHAVYLSQSQITH